MITSLTKRLVGEGTSQDIEYKQEVVQNTPSIAQNTVVSVAKKVEDNVLHMMTAPVVALQPTVPQAPMVNPLCALLKAPNALVIKQVFMPKGKLKATKPWPKPAEARAQQ